MGHLIPRRIFISPPREPIPEFVNRPRRVRPSVRGETRIFVEIAANQACSTKEEIR
jgi:hypothetical protein